MIKYIFAIVLFILAGLSVVAQELITSPAFHPAVANKYLEQKNYKAATEALKLPFYDDFSVISVYPSPLRWADNFAFINTDFAKNPPSVGVATMDVLDDKGALYPGAGQYQFSADNLTSLPIRLDSVFSPVKKAISRKDSVYLSFYYQPQGRSFSPPSEESLLILEFHSPGENDSTGAPVWREKWSTTGGIQVDTFAKPNDRYFRQVLIPVKEVLDSIRYYKNGFQFRFRNVGKLKANDIPNWRSNGSIWNIDVVSLNTGRNIHDTLVQDVAFADIAPSMLRNYQAMPLNQYTNNFINEMKDTLDIKIANLYNLDQNISYKYNVRKNSMSTLTASYDGGSFKIKPYLTYGYSDYQPFARPPVNFFFPTTNEEKVVYHVTHMLSPDINPLYRSNDSIIFDQLFSNYYAYDNGSSEAGIGIEGAGSYAVQFKLNVTDTIMGIQIYFNPVVGNVTQQVIDLSVWNDTYGMPGQKIKTLKNVIPVYTSQNNEFITYWLDTPLVINAGDFPGLIFYIGWSQSSTFNLNVGLDRYNDSGSKRFYTNAYNEWEMSFEPNYYGSVMMRPIIGEKNPTGITEHPITEKLSFSPNPVSNGSIVIQLPESWKNDLNGLAVNIVSATGSTVLSEVFSNPVDVSGLVPGFYMLIVTDKTTGKRAVGKLVIR